MVLTRAMHKARVSNDNCSNTKTKPSDRSHETSAVVHGDAARVAVDKHTSARSKGTKSDSALKPELSKEDKLARSRYRAAVPKSDAVKRPSGRKSSRGKKPRQGHQATNRGRGSKSSMRLAGPSGDSVVDSPPQRTRAHCSGKTGTKRNRESGGDTTEPDTVHRANARRVRRRIHSSDDGAGQREPIVSEVSRESGCGARPSCQVLRRSARLASKSSRPVPQDRCSLTEGVDRIVDRSNQTRRKRTRVQECNGNRPEESSPRHIRRSIREAAEVETEGRTSGSDTRTESSEETLVGNGSHPSNLDRPGRNEEGFAPARLVKIEDIDLDCLLGVDNECYGSVDTDTSAYRRNRGSTESRSSSVESLLTPPPPCMEEDEQVLLHHDFDAMIPLDAIPDEDERNALDRAYLRQLQENRPDDEADVDAVMADDRYRSLAPEPDQGLVDAIRSGRIAGLASPERSVREE